MFNLFSSDIENDIKTHAGEEYPKESCGFVINNQYVRCRNVSNRPEIRFELGAADHNLLLEEGVQAFIHSHPDDYFAPSAADMEAQARYKIPFGICATTIHGGGRILYFGDCLPVEPLEGRPFIHGVTDCYNIIRDWYKLNRDIDLPIFPRDWEWWNKGQCLYKDGFEKAGFVKIEPSQAQEGDVVLCAIRSNTPNHGAIYLNPHKVLHHIGSSNPVSAERKSKHDNMKLIARYMTHVLRYVGNE